MHYYYEGLYTERGIPPELPGGILEVVAGWMDKLLGF